MEVCNCGGATNQHQDDLFCSKCGGRKYAKAPFLRRVYRNDICRGGGIKIKKVSGSLRWHIDYTVDISFTYPYYYAGKEHHDDDGWSSEPKKIIYPDRYCLELYASDLDEALAEVLKRFRRIEKACQRAQKGMKVVTDVITFSVKLSIDKIWSCDVVVKDWKIKVNPEYLPN